jgi:hypothetical protein
MSYVPVRCDACGVVSLTSERACWYGETVCPDCGAQARVLPGCSYSETDLTLFADLRSLLQQAELSATDTAELALVMEQFRFCEDHRQAFANLVEHLPSLAPALTILMSDPTRIRAALTMLSTLVRYRAHARVSGFLESSPSSRALRRA